MSRLDHPTEKEKRAGYLPLNFLLKQTVAVAVPIEAASATQLQTGLGVAFRVEFNQLDPVGGDECHEGDEMLLCHPKNSPVIRE